MIHYIRGKIGMVIPGAIVVETNGIGYEVHVPENSSAYQKQEGSDIMLYTAMIVREDDMSLYGFTDKEGLSLFKILTTVNGIGAKAGMAILSALPTPELKRAIVNGDVDMLTRANGVGKKTAQRIVLELRDKFGKDEIASSDIPMDIKGEAMGDKAEAVAALVSLGYSKVEAQQAVLSIKEEAKNVSEYVRLALRKLG